MGKVKASDRVGTIVCSDPGAARLFEDLKIDYCCGGHLSLAEACERQHLDLNATLSALQQLTSLSVEGDSLRPADLSLTALIHHLESTHHAYLHQALPRLQALASKVAAVHGDRNPRLVELSALLEHLAVELLHHLQQEETVLFPWIKRLDAGDAASSSEGSGSPAAAMLQMDREHTEAAAQLIRLRALSDDYSCPDWGCSNYRDLMEGLRQFEADLHQHVHKENNLLLPRAIALIGTGTVTSATLRSHQKHLR
jgi:regulator of cell morphogenesis and NO signaling